MSKEVNAYSKYYEEQDVIAAYKARIAMTIAEFPTIIVSYSGGKDSGVMLNLLLDYIRETKPRNKFILFHTDYECQYDQSTEHIKEMIEVSKEYMEIAHICLPLKTQSSISMYQDSWYPWHSKDKDIWVRKLPEGSINYKNAPEWFREGITDYEFYKIYAEKLAEKYGKVGVLVGIRTDESIDRLRTIVKNENRYKDYCYTRKVSELVYNIYPIYDFKVADIWKVVADRGYKYNKLYDIFYQAGISPNEMRVASPFNDAAAGTLHLYKSINPDMWGKMINRVNGVQFASIYANTDAFAWKKIVLPEGHTWKSYCIFLLDTLPEELKQNYIKKFNTSIKFWAKKGGLLYNETLDELSELGIEYKVHSVKEGKKVVTFSDYPDNADVKTNFASVPSYKRMCITILKNDSACKYMGFAPTKDARLKRQKAENMLKDNL